MLTGIIFPKCKSRPVFLLGVTRKEVANVRNKPCLIPHVTGQN